MRGGRSQRGENSTSKSGPHPALAYRTPTEFAAGLLTSLGGARERS